MRTIHLDTVTLKAASRLISAAFPSYTGKTGKVQIHDGNMPLNSYWSGGCRDYFTLVDLSTGKVKSVPQNGTMFDKADLSWQMTPGVAVIELSKRPDYDTVTIHLHPDNAASLQLPAQADLDWASRVVLTATASLKSSYGGKTRQQRATEDTGITAQEYDTAKQALITVGLLSKQGAITPAGRNALGDRDSLYSLKRPAAV